MCRNYQSLVNDLARELTWDLANAEDGQFATLQARAVKLRDMQNLCNTHRCEGWFLGDPVHFTLDGPGFPGKRVIGILRDIDLVGGKVTLDYFGETIVQHHTSALGGISGCFDESFDEWMAERERRGLPAWEDLFTRHGYP